MIYDTFDKRFDIEFAQEWEDRAIERVVLCNETFLSHYFEVRVCLECWKGRVFSVSRARREIGSAQWIVTRRVCTECGKCMRAETTPIGEIAYRRSKQIRNRF